MIMRKLRVITSCFLRATILVALKKYPVLALSFGCIIPKYRADIVSVEFTDISLTKTKIKANVSVYYKWLFPLKISDIRYKFLLNDVVVAEGSYPNELKFGRKADTLLSFPITLNNVNLPLSLIDAILTSEFNYELDMSLKFKAWLLKRSCKITHKGMKKL